jgi:cellobiose phosphorylase
MQFGYFDENAKEYVITRPDTPQSWSNYLGSTQYGALITNNAGGYGFYQSGARGRFLRLRFNSIPMDQPGRYFYLRDNESKEYWSASWQPVGKPLDQFKSTCRHGTAYTTIESCFSEIRSEATYFVPINQNFEYWKLKVSNESGRPRRLSVFTYCEFTNQWDTFQDQVNLQYSLFIIRGDLLDKNILRLAIQDNLTPESGKFFLHDIARHTWMTLLGAPVTGFDTNREAFLGTYGGYHNPGAVENGKCSNSRVYGDNACGSLQTELDLQPGEEKEILVMLGIGDARSTGRKAIAAFGTLDKANIELARLKAQWHSKLESFKVETPDKEFDQFINVWAPYNCLVTFAWSRSASLVYNGERDGLGFRDSVQDVLGVVSSIPEEARQRLELMLTGQVSNGGAMPVIRPFEHQPGHEKPPAPEEYRSDDCLWFFNAIPAYVNESGDFDFYEKVLPYADTGEGTVLNHLRRALEFNLERTGKNGLPCGLAADWNDCLRLGYYGESLFVAFQLIYGLQKYSEIAGILGEIQDVAWAHDEQRKLEAHIQSCAWDHDRFIWAIGENGEVFGTKSSAEGQLYLNTQVWSVISGAASQEQAKQCLETVYQHLHTPFGLMLAAPPFIKSSIDIMRAVVYNPGIKENSGIFNHTQGWGVIAECIQRNGNRAYEYYRATMPAAYNTRAEIRQCEPYVCAQTTYSTYSPRAGNTRTSWLSGAAAWNNFSATQYILGIRPETGGLRVDPCIPSHWESFSVTRTWRKKTWKIKVYNPNHVCSGVTKVLVDGSPIAGNLISPNFSGIEHSVEVWLGNQ